MTVETAAKPTETEMGTVEMEEVELELATAAELETAVAEVEK